MNVIILLIANSFYHFINIIKDHMHCLIPKILNNSFVIIINFIILELFIKFIEKSILALALF